MDNAWLGRAGRPHCLQILFRVTHCRRFSICRISRSSIMHKLPKQVYQCTATNLLLNDHLCVEEVDIGLYTWYQSFS